MYIFTSAQTSALQTLSNQQWKESPTRAAFYHALLLILEQPDASGTDGGLDGQQLRLWLRGAEQANQGVGLFSELIRGYTNTQSELRGLGPVSAGDMQLASNAVGDNLIKNILEITKTAGGSAPTLKEVAIEDAKGVGEFLFKLLGSDTAYTHNSAWSGTLLFSMLGGSETTRLYEGSGLPGAIDTVDDIRNVLFSIQSFSTAFGNGIDLLTRAYPSLTEGRLKSLMASVFSTGAGAALALVSGLAPSLQSEAQAAVNDLSVLSDTLSLWRGSSVAGVYDTLLAALDTNNFSTSLLKLVFEGTPVSSLYQSIDKLGLTTVTGDLARLAGLSSDTSLQSVMASLVTKAGVDGTVISLEGKTPVELVTLVKTDGAVQKSLEALSIFCFPTIQASSVETHSDAWVLSRAGMLVALTKADSSGLVQYVDKSTGLTAQGESSDGVPRRVVFGADVHDGSIGIDMLYGTNKVNDILSGGSGNDVLDGGTGADQLFGGMENDTFFVDNSGDTVIEYVNEGTDTGILQGNWSAYQLPDNVENLFLQEDAIVTTLAGNVLDNIITGNASTTSISGGAGNDTLTTASAGVVLDGGTGHNVYSIVAGDQIQDSGGSEVITIQDSPSDGVISYNDPKTNDNLIIHVDGNALHDITVAGWFARYAIVKGNLASYVAQARQVLDATGTVIASVTSDASGNLDGSERSAGDRLLTWHKGLDGS
ncbi:MAG: calcium-binding protein, partial [Agitococcus sp.]|nr:calcium-binding protein [Agitococcus sp.]